MAKKPSLTLMFIPIGAAILMLSGCAQQSAGIPPGQPEATVSSHSPRELFMEKCSRCHEARKAYAVVDEREKWIKLVAAMATKDLGWINTDQMRTIISYHEEHPGVLSETFDRKCGSCHHWDTLRPLEKSASQWRTMINFMGNRSPGGLDRDEAEILFTGLTTG